LRLRVAALVRRPDPGKVEAMGGRGTLVIVLASAIVFAAVGAAFALGQERSYRARAFVIQVPAALGKGRAVELARSDRVLRQALELADADGITIGELRRHSQAESTSRLDIALTVEAGSPDLAIRLATGYAKAVRREIPDDEGLPTRGVGARRAQGELGPVGWGLIGSLIGAGVGFALAVVRDGLRRGSARAPGPASAPSPHAR
jgi:hypothetical protein